jgi:hypothetical protein
MGPPGRRTDWPQPAASPGRIRFSAPVRLGIVAASADAGAASDRRFVSNLRITRLRLKNWRNFKMVDIRVQGRVILLGANASGKSNLLDSLRFFHDIVRTGGGLQKAVADRGGLSRLRYLNARYHNKGWLSLNVDLGDDEQADQWSYKLELSRAVNGPVVIKREAISRNGIELISRPDSDDEEDPERLTQTAIEQVARNREFRDVADFFRGGEISTSRSTAHT